MLGVVVCCACARAPEHRSAARSPVLDAQANRLDELTRRLADTAAIAAARDAIAGLHRQPGWKPATDRDYKPLAPRHLDDVGAALAAAAAPIRDAAAKLRAGRIADGIGSLDATVTALYAGPLHDLASDLADELAFDRDIACAHARCDGLAAIGAAFD